MICTVGSAKGSYLSCYISQNKNALDLEKCSEKTKTTKSNQRNQKSNKCSKSNRCVCTFLQAVDWSSYDVICYNGISCFKNIMVLQESTYKFHNILVHERRWNALTVAIQILTYFKFMLCSVYVLSYFRRVEARAKILDLKPLSQQEIRIGV